MLSTRKLIAGAAGLAAIALVLSGCTNGPTGGGDDTEFGVVDESLTAPPADAEVGDPSADICNGKEYRIGVNIYSTGVTFGIDTVAGADALVEKIGCVEYVLISDDFDPAKAITNINSLLQQDVDAVLLLTASDAAVAEAVRLVQEAGKPIVSGIFQAEGVPFVEVDFKAAGAEGGEGVANAFKEAFPGVTPYLILGTLDSAGPAVTLRSDGQIEGMQAVFPDMDGDHIIKVPTEADPATSGQNAVGALSLIPAGSPIIVASFNDDTAYAMLQAVTGAGYEAYGLGMGGDSGGQALVCEGTFFTDAWFPEKIADYTFPVLIGMLNGKDMPAYVPIETAFLSAETVNDVYPGTC
jgi:ABC-type sugar transport system substrate-binding protein